MEEPIMFWEKPENIPLIEEYEKRLEGLDYDEYHRTHQQILREIRLLDDPEERERREIAIVCVRAVTGPSDASILERSMGDSLVGLLEIAQLSGELPQGEIKTEEDDE
jgi:hypothetical protein